MTVLQRDQSHLLVNIINQGFEKQQYRNIIKMKGSKAVRTHLSTQKIQNSFEKSAKERKASKNLYTLNKESDDEDSDQTSPMHDYIEPQKHSRKPKNPSYKPQRTPSQSEDDSHNKRLSMNPRIKPNPNQPKYHPQNSQSYSSYSDDDQNAGFEEQQRIKKYTVSNQNDRETLKMHITIKQLQQENSLLNQSLLAHQNRQKDMIAKFAKLEAQNKRLQYQIVKISKSSNEKKLEEQNLKRVKKQIEAVKNAHQEVLAFVQTQNMRILSYIKALLGKLIIDPSIQSQAGKTESKSVAEYLDKCLLTLKQNRKILFKKFSLNQHSKQNLSNNIQLVQGHKNSQTQKQPEPQFTHFDFSYERQRILQINEDNSKLKDQIKRLQEQFGKLSDSYKKATSEKETQIKQKQSQIKEKQNLIKDKQTEFKRQKTQLCEKYNQAIEQLKTKCKTVDRKIEEQEEKYEFKISELEKLLAQKDKIIKKLKEQLKQMNVKLEEIEEERFDLHNSSLREGGRQTGKKKFIDGDLLNSSLNSNKQKSISREISFYKDQCHEQSFYEFKPDKRKKKSPWNEDGDVMLRKSQKKKKVHTKQQRSVQEEENDIKKIDREIEKLEREVLRQFENSN